MMITPGLVRITRNYTIDGEVEPVRDASRCPLAPTSVEVNFDNRSGGVIHVSYVRVEGRRLRGERTRGQFNQAGFPVKADGTVLANSRGDFPPAWLQEVVSLALAEQALTPITA
jgi:hypothetical protein